MQNRDALVKLSSRDIGLLLGSLILSSIPVGYLQVVLPLYLNRAGLEPTVIGLLYSVSGIVTAILNPTPARTFIGIGFAVPIESAATAAGQSPF